MPQLGESIAEATVVQILIQSGESVEADKDVLEVETNKAVMGVTAPCVGEIKEWIAVAGESYPVGAVLGYLEVAEAEAKRLGIKSEDPVVEEVKKTKARKETKKAGASVEPTLKGGLPVPASLTGASYLSPRMKARMTELGLHASDLSGIAGTNPVMATILTILLFSLAGIPPLAGFWGKWYVFLAAINAHLYALAVIGVLASVVGAYYYLRIIKLMWFDEPVGGFQPMATEVRVVLGVSGVFVLFYVLIGGPIAAYAEAAAKTFF